jgi:hypothetical protein
VPYFDVRCSFDDARAPAAAGDRDRAAELLEHAIALAPGRGGAAIEREATAILDEAEAPPTPRSGSAAVPLRRP